MIIELGIMTDHDSKVFAKSSGMTVVAYDCSLTIRSKCFGRWGIHLNEGDEASNGFCRVKVLKKRPKGWKLEMRSAKPIEIC
jgi:hypothetical protein